MMTRHEAEIDGATCACCRWSDGNDDCSLYNEVIYDTAVLSPNYTLANIEAVIFPAMRVRSVQEFAREVHAALLENGGVRRPLLQYNALVESNATIQPAFTLVHA